jgi:hypothetical protein
MATQKRLTIHLNGEPLEITLRTSTVEDGLARGEMIALQAKALEHESQIRKIAGTVLMPVCLCSVEHPRSLRTMGLEEFLLLDEQDMDAWLKLAYELNPHWLFKVEPPADAEKKTGAGSNGSGRSMKHPAKKPATSRP